MSRYARICSHRLFDVFIDGFKNEILIQLNNIYRTPEVSSLPETVDGKRHITNQVLGIFAFMSSTVRKALP